LGMKKNLLLIVLISVFAGSCQWQSETKPSILVIAVDSLSSDFITCFDETESLNSGFATLCSESVRFTHAFTTSTMSVAALSSVLTAQYPYETSVFNNGSNYLLNEFETIAEVAISKGYRTSLFSGGAPVFRKTGLGQGFEVF